MEVVKLKQQSNRQYSLVELTPSGSRWVTVDSGLTKEQADARVPKALDRRKRICQHLRDVRAVLHVMDVANGKLPREFDKIVE